MKLIGQRWVYEVGNSRVVIDNAFSWSLWGQERFIVNDEVVGETGGGLRFAASAKVPWLSRIGDSTLRLSLTSQLRGIRAEANLDDEPIEPTEIRVARWNGPRGSWPPDEIWSDQPPLSWVSR